MTIVLDIQVPLADGSLQPMLGVHIEIEKRIYVPACFEDKNSPISLKWTLTLYVYSSKYTREKLGYVSYLSKFCKVSSQ